jgi:hypothetical protein
MELFVNSTLLWSAPNIVSLRKIQGEKRIA